MVSLSAQTSILQNSKFYIGDFVRIVKRTKYSERDTNNLLLTRYLRFYYIIDANEEKIEVKFYQTELQLVRERSEQNVSQSIWRLVHITCHIVCIDANNQIKYSGVIS